VTGTLWFVTCRGTAQTSKATEVGVTTADHLEQFENRLVRLGDIDEFAVDIEWPCNGDDTSRDWSMDTKEGEEPPSRRGGPLIKVVVHNILLWL